MGVDAVTLAICNLTYNKLIPKQCKNGFFLSLSNSMCVYVCAYVWGVGDKLNFTGFRRPISLFKNKITLKIQNERYFLSCVVLF